MNSDWLELDVMEDYLEGKLDAKAMYLVEKHALEDPFVAEALEGLSQSPKRKHQLSILQKRLQERTAQKPVKRKTWNINTQRLSIAATATVAFIAVSVLYMFRENSRREAEKTLRGQSGVVVNLDANAKAQAGAAVVAPEQAKIESATIPAVKNKDIQDQIAKVKKAKAANEETTAVADGVASQISESTPALAARSAKVVNESALSASVLKSEAPIPTEDFENYVAQNNRLIKDGYTGEHVLLGFKVNPNGSITAIKILKAGTANQNAEAIRLVENGPKWKIVKNTIDSVTVAIKF